IVGNLGLNTRLVASDAEPVTMYAKDFDGNGVTDQIVSVYNHGTSYPIAMRDELISALPYLGQRYSRYEDYARQTVTDIFSPGELLRDEGAGRFTPVPAAQSGFFVPGQARDIQRVRTRRGDLYVVTRNNDRPLIFRPSSPFSLARGSSGER